MKRILIIDDNAEVGQVTSESLEATGHYQVRVATRGDHGLKLSRQYRPHLILLDIEMPGMDGLSVLRKLKENLDTLSIPVLMLSGNTDNDSKQQATQFYNDGYIEKPVLVQDLIARIDKVIGFR